MSRRHARRRGHPTGRQVPSSECVPGTALEGERVTPPGASVGTMTGQRRRQGERDEARAQARLRTSHARLERMRARYGGQGPAS